MRRSAVITLLILLISACFVYLGNDELSVEGDLLDESKLVSRAPILIEGDVNFTSGNGVSSGNGSFENPYIIENWSISAADEIGITINDTTSYFIIRNCLVKDGYMKNVRYIEGIHLKNVQNGTIRDCRSWNNGGGIQAFDSANIMVFNNSFEVEGGVHFHQYSRNVTIRNNTFEGAGIGTSYLSSHININNNTGTGGEPFSISIFESGDCIVENNICSAIDLQGSDNCVVKDNKITVIQYSGMQIYESSSNRISNNRIEIPAAEMGPRGPDAFQIYSSRDNLFINNTIINGGLQIFGRELEDYNTNHIDTSNTFNGKPPLFLKDNSTPAEWSSGYGIYILVNCEDQVIYGLDMDGISPGVMVAYSRNITVTDCSFSNVEFGVYAEESEELEIFNITVENCLFGVETDDCQYVHIHNCTVTGALYGIFLYRSSHCEIVDNKAHSSTEGIRLYTKYGEGENITAMRNVLSNNVRGLVMWRSISAYNNSITSNTECGIEVKGGPSLVSGNKIMNNGIGIKFDEYGGGNTIKGNMILSNEIGIQLNVDCQRNIIFENEISQNTGYAIEITDWRVRSSLIYNNSFNNNNQGGVQAKDDGEFTKWDNGTEGGNYWNDYISRYVPPATNDGTFWSTPYVVDGSQGNQDNYPLVFSRVSSEKVLKLSTTNQVEAYVGREYSVNYWVAYTGDRPNSIEWKFHTNASWLSFDRNHTLRGRPTLTDIGSYWVNISVTDGALSDNTNFTITVSVRNFPPEITTSNTETVDQWTDYRVDYNATDENESLLVWKLITNATFLSMNNITGVLSGTPGLNDTGVFYINVSVTDGVFITDNWFDLTVIDVNDPPMMNSSLTGLHMLEDDILVRPIRDMFFNYDEEPLNISASGTDNISAVINESGMMLVIPEPDWYGIENLTFRVSDGYYNKTFEIVVHVQNVNDAPRELVIHTSGRVFKLGGDQTVFATFFDPDMDDQANITWTVEGIGILGYGVSINLSLPEGTFNLTLRVTDSTDNYSEVSMVIIVERAIAPHTSDEDRGTPWLLIGLVSLLILGIIAFVIFILRKRSRMSDASKEDLPILPPNLTRRSIGPHGPGLDMDMELEPDVSMQMESDGIMSDQHGGIPWMTGLDENIIAPLEEAFNYQDTRNVDKDMEFISTGLKKKFQEGYLTEEEYTRLSSFIGLPDEE